MLIIAPFPPPGFALSSFLLRLPQMRILRRCSSSFDGCAPKRIWGQVRGEPPPPAPFRILLHHLRCSRGKRRRREEERPPENRFPVSPPPFILPAAFTVIPPRLFPPPAPPDYRKGGWLGLLLLLLRFPSSCDDAKAICRQRRRKKRRKKRMELIPIRNPLAPLRLASLQLNSRLLCVPCWTADKVMGYMYLADICLRNNIQLYQRRVNRKSILPSSLPQTARIYIHL